MLEFLFKRKKKPMNIMGMQELMIFTDNIIENNKCIIEKELGNDIFHTFKIHFIDTKAKVKLFTRVFTGDKNAAINIVIMQAYKSVKYDKFKYRDIILEALVDGCCLIHHSRLVDPMLTEHIEKAFDHSRAMYKKLTTNNLFK